MFYLPLFVVGNVCEIFLGCIKYKLCGQIFRMLVPMFILPDCVVSLIIKENWIRFGLLAFILHL
jgi:hypothetical protein